MGGSQSDKNVQLCADRFKKRRSWRMTPLPPRRNPTHTGGDCAGGRQQTDLELRQQQIIYSSFVTSVAPFTHKMAKISVSPCAAVFNEGAGARGG
ncbi:hypothetical protein MdSGHV081 [Musca domestica salivary gland hypertrophy virus]|uniref:Uncharacterized protein n=1 Tax=Musca hytrovirus(isolate Musca domestica/United States/Boucias/-) TaxID=523909 RepID=B2YG58_MHVB|nr:hypothetical protein MdSGHV081 [Musca domestica salivary gland hypertrophy virus]ACD03540.1 hypothetical protein MdSGHV081 [Musca domestica salivary gland hypertrophy virus]